MIHIHGIYTILILFVLRIGVNTKKLTELGETTNMVGKFSSKSTNFDKRSFELQEIYGCQDIISGGTRNYAVKLWHFKASF